ncbi:MAG TPA: NAD-dependent epimerase/dehydratase family protein, partial [Longimicrobium sp.]|nr:NAD-dependent epimerase/dehydratase family protein [Longimicrobium sp.]
MTDAGTSTTAGSPMRVAVSGSTGLIGGALVQRLLREGHTVARLVRSAKDAGPGDVVWDPAAGTIDAAALEGMDAVVHLAAENVGSRWSEEKKRRIRDSRVNGTRLISETISRLARPPRVL